MQQLDLGQATISPTAPLVAGAYATLTWTYTAGHPIDDTGCLKLAFRYAGDFGRPQFTDPKAANYCTVQTTGQCRVEPRWDPQGHTRPWGLSLYLRIMAGYLDRGEQVILVFGERSGGSLGWQVQTFCESSFEFKSLVDPIATVRFKELPESPTLAIIPGLPAKAVCLAPSLVQVGEPFSYHLKLEDAWGNPCARPTALRHPGLATPGTHWLTARDEASGLVASSNPVQAVATLPGLRPYWADLHGQSEETIGTNSITDYFSFARDYALVDLAGHQGNEFQITDAFWVEINATTKAFNEPGRFVTFPGFEWSGNTPLGGDRNVFYAHEGGPIIHSCTDLLPNEHSDGVTALTAEALFAELHRRPDLEPFLIPHVGGRYADLRLHDPVLEPVVELHSAWGTFEWMLEDALRLGYRVGVVANSDGHKGRPGASYPGASKFGSYGGLTCYLATALDRAPVLAAMRARHCYATTGHRPLITVQVRTADGQEGMMGDALRTAAGPLQLRLTVAGTAPLERVELRLGCRTLQSWQPGGEPGADGRVQVLWRGAERRGRARQVTWDGELTVPGNRLLTVAPINFWNPAQPLRQVAPERLTWQTITTGGMAGALLHLAEPGCGLLAVRTTQGELSVDLASLGAAPVFRDCGGLGKELRVSRLPAQPGPRLWELSTELPAAALPAGEHALYLKVTQEDGHLAWTSPIYLTIT